MKYKGLRRKKASFFHLGKGGLNSTEPMPSSPELDVDRAAKSAVKISPLIKILNNDFKTVLGIGQSCPKNRYKSH